MTVYYLDSSAWVKRYYAESGTPDVQHLFSVGGPLACSSLGVVEVTAALARKLKSREIGERDFHAKLTEVGDDWSRFIQVRLTDEMVEVARRLAIEYPLRGADAIHLASATMLRRRLSDSAGVITIVSSDLELNAAARARDFTVTVPGAHSQI